MCLLAGNSCTLSLAVPLHFYALFGRIVHGGWAVETAMGLFNLAIAADKYSIIVVLSQPSKRNDMKLNEPIFQGTILYLVEKLCTVLETRLERL